MNANYATVATINEADIGALMNAFSLAESAAFGQMNRGSSAERAMAGLMVATLRALQSVLEISNDESDASMQKTYMGFRAVGDGGHVTIAAQSAFAWRAAIMFTWEHAVARMDDDAINAIAKKGGAEDEAPKYGGTIKTDYVAAERAHLANVTRILRELMSA